MPRPQSVGVIWHLALPAQPAALAPALPARFGQVGPADVTELTQAMGRADPGLVQRRLDAARRGYAGWAQGQLACYGWVSFTEEVVGELGLRLRLLPNEAYIWDCATLPAFQRQGLYAALLSHMAQSLQAEGLSDIWIGADSANEPSHAGIARAGFTAVADLLAAPPQPSERRRRGWLEARPGISPALLAKARRAYLGDREPVWLFDNPL